MSNAKPTASPSIVLRGSSFSSVSPDKSSNSSDFDRYSYASSLGQTTPEDDENKIFKLDVRHTSTSESDTNLRPVLRGSFNVKKAATALHHRQRTLSSIVKTVSRAFTVFKKRKSDEEEPVFIASPLRERFGRRISVKMRPEQFYSLPNRYFSVHDLPLQKAKTVGHRAERRIASISGPPSSNINKPSRRLRSPNFSLPLVEELQAATPLSPPVATQVPLADSFPEECESSQHILIGILRVVLFVPWCAAVGGALLLFPQKLEAVVFRPGYLESSQGIRHFAYWAECAFHHAVIFLAFVVVLAWSMLLWAFRWLVGPSPGSCMSEPVDEGHGVCVPNASYWRL
ncbi:hypothetical protein DEU56DRAFT_900269 [Suillus clintonianus]|uniref:uncharacterized protein n=1 Tax=Suillus clintonianus TaxID=1904413 RepID=UPI001B8784DB|nr:uncharacterized protein DEU56DRAFT_900269 [Suillus clintonianus]KAG2143727.1 hypothetical protein DEU56DRAFT_900269 [Suillus clintonianus]